MKTITIAGKLGRDAEIRHTQGGDSVTSFSVAVDERGKGGEKHTFWFDCSLWGKRGEALAQYLTKGSSICVAGDFSMRSYQTKDGAERTTLSVRVSEVTLLGGGNRDGGQQGNRAPAQRQESHGYGDFDDSEDSIPF